MLSTIYIKNLAIIDELQISFKKGLNIITGETGSGKSLIITAIKLLMGEKFTKELLRTGTEILVIEGTFLINNSNIIIRRIYKNNGKSRAFINDEPANQKDFIEYTSHLIDIHGQHNHQNLLNKKTHLDYIDSFGSYNDKLNIFLSLYHKVSQCKDSLDNKIKIKKENDQKRELQKFQLKELTLYDLTNEFEEDLSKTHILFSKASSKKEGFAKVLRTLDNSDSGILKSMYNIAKELKNISDYDDSIKSLLDLAENSRINLEDLSKDIQSLQNNIVFDQNKIDEINENISYLEMLKRKYGGSIESVISYRDQLIKSEKETDGLLEVINQLESQLKDLNLELVNHSETISNERKMTSYKLEQAIKNNLEHLNMSKTQFKIKINCDPGNITKNGMDTCEFFISTNSGEELKSVNKIASGGEISRIMLAIKMALQSKDIVETLIFDEIDSGISGMTAAKVGTTIENLSKTHQILCITHLSQIAGKGDCHFRVSKKAKDNRIIVKVAKLSKKERIREVATLISGHSITEISKKKAQELLQFNG
jgi:DNA repair protein RecN (Recombination protein N)